MEHFAQQNPMQVTTEHKHGGKPYTYHSIPCYVEQRCQPKPYSVSGVAEEAQRTADNVAAALGRLCEVLLNSGLITPLHLAEIVGDDYDLETISVHH